MKKIFCFIIAVLAYTGTMAQEKGGMVVNKFRHTPLLLNAYSSAVSDKVENVVSAAYSLRRINLFYNGPLVRVRVRKSSTWYEYDIDFTDEGELDTVSLKANVGARDAYVIKWYDQSGNGRDASPSGTATSAMPMITDAGVIYRKGTNNRPAVTFQDASQELYYTGTTTAQVVNAVRDLVGNSYQYLLSMPADADFSVRASGGYTAASGGGYSDGPNANDWWFGGSMYVNNAAISGSSSGAVRALHTLVSIASSAKSGTFSISNTSSSAWADRGMYNGDGVCELLLLPSSSGMTVSATRLVVQNNQKAYFGTP